MRDAAVVAIRFRGSGGAAAPRPLAMAAAAGLRSDACAPLLFLFPNMLAHVFANIRVVGWVV